MLEDLVQIDLMDSLISVIYAELLEGIVLEHFEPIDIEHLYQLNVPFWSLILINFPIKLLDNPEEQVFIQGLGHRISSLDTLFFSHGQKECISGNDLLIKDKAFPQHLLFHHQ